MEATEDANTIFQILDSFGILNVSDEIIDIIKRGEIDNFDPDLMRITIDDTTGVKLSELEKIFKRYFFKGGDEDGLWACLREQSCFPIYVASLCFYFCSTEGTHYVIATKIFAYLICGHVMSEIWNPILFQHVLAPLIGTSKLLTSGGQLNEETKRTLNLSSDLAQILIKGYTKKFAKMVGPDIIIALSELSLKLISGNRSEFDQYNSKFSEFSVELLAKISESSLDLLLPFLVQGLLFQFAPNAATLTKSLERIWNKILEVSLNSFQGPDERLPLFIKHLAVRVPERAFIRRLVADAVYKLTVKMTNPIVIIDFCLRLSKSQRVGQRSFSALVLPKFLINMTSLTDDENNSTSYSLTIASTLIRQTSDVAATVRSCALEAITLVLKQIGQIYLGDVIRPIINSESNSLVKILSKRIFDEKLIVRRAALSCAQEFVDYIGHSPDADILDIISGRVRDRSVSIRSSAIKAMNVILDDYRTEEAVRLSWLDSILPVVTDPVDSVQKEAIESINKFFFSQPGDMIPILNAQHFDFMETVFTTFRNKEISMKPLCKTLIAMAEEDEKAWQILFILFKADSKELCQDSHYGKALIKKWGNRSEYPAEYYSILAMLGCKSDEIAADCSNYLENALNTSNVNFSMLHSIVSLFRNQSPPEFWVTLMDNCTKFVNDTVFNQNTTAADVDALIGHIFLIGEIAFSQNMKALDYDYRGLQLLLNEQLPQNIFVSSKVAAVAAITLSKLSLLSRDVARQSAEILEKALRTSEDPVLKCNLIVGIADIGKVNGPFIEFALRTILNCFADPSPIVRHQALLVETRMIVEDHIKMKHVHFFRYVYAITDPDKETAKFARICLFNVLFNKDPTLLKAHFLGILNYFNDKINTANLQEYEEEHELFRIKDHSRVHQAIRYIVDKISSVDILPMIKEIFDTILDKFNIDEYDVIKDHGLLEDAIESLLTMEVQMKQASEIDANTDDERTEVTLEVEKRAVSMVHSNMILSILPILNRLHKKMRDAHSPLQGKLRKFYNLICEKNPNLLQLLETTEPLLAEEIKHEMETMAVEVEEEITPPSTPRKKAEFSSPLLSHIASTPRTLLTSPGTIPVPQEGIADTPVAKEEGPGGNGFQSPKLNSDIFD